MVIIKRKCENESFENGTSKWTASCRNKMGLEIIKKRIDSGCVKQNGIWGFNRS